MVPYSAIPVPNHNKEKKYVNRCYLKAAYISISRQDLGTRTAFSYRTRYNILQIPVCKRPGTGTLCSVP
jgi:hypothetical protein